jgi:1-pyrroline-5-carboxylate dehydrogenase
MLLPNSRPHPPRPANEPTLQYAPGSPERAALKAELARLSGETADIPLVIAGEHIRTGKLGEQASPQQHQKIVARFHEGGTAEVDKAIAAARAAWKDWAASSWSSRAAIFLRAADLVAGKYRQTLNAATMLGQGKSAYQAEIDAACEFADFLRFNVHYASQLYADQPDSSPGVWNAVELRPLEGFVLAVSPFNFTAIAGNLPAAPALMGNTVVWKPSALAALSNSVVQKIFEEAGLPPGVINVVQGPAPEIVGHALGHPDLAGVHFTGSTAVFQGFWKTVGERIAGYKTYPRLVGETGGKDFIVAHASADPDAVVAGVIRAGYEFSGQKCSALSRLYLSRSLFQRIEKRLVEQIEGLKVGDPADFSNFTGAVINKASFDRLSAAIDQARKDPGMKILAGGKIDGSVGWFVRPTLAQTSDPRHDLMQRELFGPFVSLFVFDDAQWDETLSLIDSTSGYGLTGAVFANDRRAVDHAHQRLRHASGNFYVNDKCTGAVVGQQPFGGARQSGTNDKAGSALNLLRWTSARTIKEVFQPPLRYEYPSMREA